MTATDIHRSGGAIQRIGPATLIAGLARTVARRGVRVLTAAP